MADAPNHFSGADCMELNYKTFGQGDPLIILHGLFGTLDNWQTLGKRWAEDYSVYMLDQRNHGRSPHFPNISYPVMAEDIRQFLEANWIHETNLLGHSMGGKTAMQLALHYPDLVNKLVVVDILPKAYPPGHKDIFDAMLSLDLERTASRQEADVHLANKIPEPGVRQFLLKNLSRNKEGGFRWKMNLPVLHNHYEAILASLEGEYTFEGPTLFIKGEHSPYIHEFDMTLAMEFFPNARLETVRGAGHWVHADQPDELFRLVSDFLAF